VPNREHYAKCFLIGGLSIGILSGLPGVQAGNCCCCMWVILGGFLAGYLLCRWAAYPVSEGEGALVGLISGAIGAVIWDLLIAIYWAVMGTAQIQEAFEEIRRRQDIPLPPGSEEMFQKMGEFFTNPILLGCILLIGFLLICCTLAPAGGFLAVTIWGRRPRPLSPGLGPMVNIPPPMAPPTAIGGPPAPAPPGPGHDDQGFFFPR